MSKVIWQISHLTLYEYIYKDWYFTKSRKVYYKYLLPQSSCSALVTNNELTPYR